MNPPGVKNHVWGLRALVVVQAALLPYLGIPTFFRNEAAWHYTLWMRTPFSHLFEHFLTRESSMSDTASSRPLVRALEWLEVHAFGLHASWYVVVNGAFFALFALMLFELGLWVGGTGTAVLAVLGIAACYPLVFYPVLNALHGLQYPLEMFLCTAAIVSMLNAFAGRRRYGWGAFVLALLAAVSHAASAVVLPLVAAMLWMQHDRSSPRRRAAYAALSALGLALPFALERQGVPGGLFSQPGILLKLEFGAHQLRALATLMLRPPGGPVLIVAALWAIGSVLLAINCRVVVSAMQRLGYLGVWTIAGVAIYASTPEQNASYARHCVVPIVVLAADAWHRMGIRIVRAMGRHRVWLARQRLWGVDLLATTALWAVVALALHFDIPGLSSRLQQARYVGDLGLAFRDALEAVLRQVPANGSLIFFAGRSRSEEMRTLYGADYFERLQPAKSEHYDDFVGILGRPDVHVICIEAGQAAPLQAGRWLVAVNPWEAAQARAVCGAEAQQILRRGKAQISLYRIPDR